MKVVLKKVEDLKPYGKNQKKHPDEQIEKIANSIREFGFNQPLVVDSNNEIIVGHGRYLGAIKAELEEVPCVVATELTKTQIKAYRIADNKLNESEWDFSLLREELQELQDENFNLDLTGFDSDMALNFDKTDVDLDDFFEDAKEKEKVSKTFVCEHCGKESSV